MRIQHFLYLVIAVLINLPATAQKEEREANAHFKDENYAVALNLYKKLLVKDTANKEYNYRLGISYLNCNSEPTAALKHLKIVETDKKTDAEFMFMVGKAYLYNYDFINAKASFESCKNLAVKNPVLKITADTWYKMSENAERMIKSPLNISFINLGKYINTEMDELTPFVTPDNEILLYTSNKKYDNQFLVYSNDVYFANMDDGLFKKGKLLSVVNSPDDEFIAGVSLSNERIFVQLQGYEAFQDLISSERKGKGFLGKTPMSASINSGYAEIGACETQNSDTLFFSSGREGGFGGMDIYYSLKLPTGEWGTARNLGDKINSPYDEDFPVLSNDGGKMYFASNRPESMGGYDIFECNIVSDAREFSTPKNIGYPLNDVFDNKTIAFSDNERYAYVSAIKPDGFGFTDLYRVVFNEMDPAVKIHILNFKMGEGENKIPYTATDTTLKITAMQKGKVFGQYAYDSKNSATTIALPPGAYSIEISGINTEEHTHKIVVPETPTGDKIEKEDVILKPKN
jgi:hypothetical protein